MSKQFFTNALDAFTKANKTRKQVLAERAGYSNPEDYKMFLKQSLGETGETIKTDAVVPTVLVIDMMDCSSSMSGRKIKEANAGINRLISEMKEENNVNYEYVLCTFSGRDSIEISEIEPIKEVKPREFFSSGLTALYLAIDQVMRRFKSEAEKGKKVLVNIYTDGEDNDSRIRASTVKKNIKEYEKLGFTFTFIGTDRDVDYVVKTMNIDASNTAKYDGTGEGLRATMDMMSVAKAAYATNVAQGKDVTKGFFKNITNNKNK